MSTNNATRLVELLRDAPGPRDYRCDRVRWLVMVADELDGLALDGAADLAAKARTEALALVDLSVQHAGGTPT